MLSASDLGDRPVTPCPNCKRADLKVVTIAGSLVCLRCRACEFLFVLEDRRSAVRPESQGQIFLLAEASPTAYCRDTDCGTGIP